ncbi:hypothetical protein [Gottfriedia sp. OAE603]
MIWGVLILNEKITMGMLVGFIVILVSVFLILDIKLPTKSKVLQHNE